MKLKFAAVAVAAAFSLSAQAQTEIQWWHSMTAVNGEVVNDLAKNFNASQNAYKIVPTFKGTYDSSVGGLGGCPYAPGAAGNLATEDLAYTLSGMGIETGVDLEKVWRAGQVAEAIVGRELPGKVHKAGIRSLAH